MGEDSANSFMQLQHQSSLEAFTLPMIKITRGFLAMCNPAPGGGLDPPTSLDDVQYVWPKSTEATQIVSDFPKLGKILVSRLRRDAQWVQRHTSLLQCFGAEKASLEDFNKVLT